MMRDPGYEKKCMTQEYKQAFSLKQPTVLTFHRILQMRDAQGHASNCFPALHAQSQIFAIAFASLPAACLPACLPTLTH